MVIVEDEKKKNSLSTSSHTVPYNFIGPIRPGTIREPAPIVFKGPVRPGTDEQTFRRTGISTPSKNINRSSSPPTITPTQVRNISISISPTPQQIKSTSIPKTITEPIRKRTISKTINISRTRIQNNLTEPSRSSIIRTRRTRKPIIRGEVQKAKVPEGFIDRKLKELEDLQKLKSTKSIRTKQKDIKNELKLIGLTVAQVGIMGTISLIALPKTLLNLATNPSNLKKVPSSIARSGKEFGQLIRISPTEAFVKIGGEILFLKGSGSALKVMGKVGGKTATRLSPKFKKIKKGKIELKVKTIISKKLPGKTKAPKKIITIKLGGSVSKIQEPLRKQVKLAGKRVTAVSVQADQLVNLIKTKKIIRKPIPNEASLPLSTKKLLRKFDKGTINKQQLIKLQGKVNVLERSLFADPRGRFRSSRLGGKQKEASFLDLLSGDVTFKTSKPQILIFHDVKISKFPKRLKDIEKALKKGETLTESQTKRLLDFQTKKTGEFKPIGALSKEPEITLAPGEIIKRVKKIGVTIINGKRVNIVQVRVVKATSSTKKLIKKAKSGNITFKEMKTLKGKLKKETGFKPSISRRSTLKPRARLPKRGLKISKRSPTRTIRRINGGSIRRRTRRTTTQRSPRRRTTTSKRTTRRTTTFKRTTRRTTAPRRPGRTTASRRQARPPKPRPPIIPPRFKSKTSKRSRRKKEKERSYNVYARPVKKMKGDKKPRPVKINRVPLSKRKARDLRNYITDTSLSRTGRIKEAKGKPKMPLLKVPKNYASKTSFKFRGYKTIKGSRKPLPKGTVIERRNRLLDTIQEKRKITLKRRIKQITPKQQRTTIRPNKGSMFKNLEKARSVKASNSKKRKR